MRVPVIACSLLLLPNILLTDFDTYGETFLGFFPCKLFLFAFSLHSQTKLIIEYGQNETRGFDWIQSSIHRRSVWRTVGLLDEDLIGCEQTQNNKQPE